MIRNIVIRLMLCIVLLTTHIVQAQSACAGSYFIENTALITSTSCNGTCYLWGVDANTSFSVLYEFGDPSSPLLLVGPQGSGARLEIDLASSVPILPVECGSDCYAIGTDSYGVNRYLIRVSSTPAPELLVGPYGSGAALEIDLNDLSQIAEKFAACNGNCYVAGKDASNNYYLIKLGSLAPEIIIGPYGSASFFDIDLQDVYAPQSCGDACLVIARDMSSKWHLFALNDGYAPTHLIGPSGSGAVQETDLVGMELPVSCGGRCYVAARTSTNGYLFALNGDYPPDILLGQYDNLISVNKPSVCNGTCYVSGADSSGNGYLYTLENDQANLLVGPENSYANFEVKITSSSLALSFDNPISCDGVCYVVGTDGNGKKYLFSLDASYGPTLLIVPVSTIIQVGDLYQTPQVELNAEFLNYLVSCGGVCYLVGIDGLTAYLFKLPGDNTVETVLAPTTYLNGAQFKIDVTMLNQVSYCLKNDNQICYIIGADSSGNQYLFVLGANEPTLLLGPDSYDYNLQPRYPVQLTVLQGTYSCGGRCYAYGKDTSGGKYLFSLNGSNAPILIIGPAYSDALIAVDMLGLGPVVNACDGKCYIYSKIDFTPQVVWELNGSAKPCIAVLTGELSATVDWLRDILVMSGYEKALLFARSIRRGTLSLSLTQLFYLLNPYPSQADLQEFLNAVVTLLCSDGYAENLCAGVIELLESMPYGYSNVESLLAAIASLPVDQQQCVIGCLLAVPYIPDYIYQALQNYVVPTSASAACFCRIMQRVCQIGNYPLAVQLYSMASALQRSCLCVLDPDCAAYIMVNTIQTIPLPDCPCDETFAEIVIRALLLSTDEEVTKALIQAVITSDCCVLVPEILSELFKRGADTVKLCAILQAVLAESTYSSYCSDSLICDWFVAMMQDPLLGQERAAQLLAQMFTLPYCQDTAQSIFSELCGCAQIDMSDLIAQALFSLTEIYSAPSLPRIGA